MKCLVLTSEYPPSKGGVGNAAATFRSQMVSRGWTVLVVSVHVEGVPVWEQCAEGIVHRLKLSGETRIGRPLCGDVERLESILAEFRPDVAVIHGWQGWCVRAVNLLNSLCVPVVLQSHGFGAHLYGWSWRPFFGLKSYLSRLPFVLGLPFFLRRLSALSVLSQTPRLATAFDHWAAHISRFSNVVTIPNGVPRVKGDPQRFYDQFPDAAGKIVILCIANYCDRKNQMLGLKVARHLRKESAFFVFIGSEENSYSLKLKNFSNRHGLNESVAILHGVTREFTESCVLACHIALMTSKWEMQPLFLLEAMSAGKPWVATDVGCISELRGGVIASFKPKSMASDVKGMLQDYASRESLGQAGRMQWSSDYSPKVVYDKWDKLLHQVIE